jgi:hypothetical protein
VGCGADVFAPVAGAAGVVVVSEPAKALEAIKVAIARIVASAGVFIVVSK